MSRHPQQDRRFLVDVDGVLGDFTTAFLKHANAIAGTHYQHDDVTEWDLCALPKLREVESDIWGTVGRPGFARTLQPYPGAVDAVRELQKLGEVFVVTSPLWVHEGEAGRDDQHGRTFCYDRVKWLGEHFGIDAKHVIFGYHKHLVEGSALIDDRVENVERWLEAHGGKRDTAAILWAQLYNEHGKQHPRMLRTNDWEDALTFLRKKMHL